MRATAFLTVAALTVYGVALGVLDAVGRRLWTPR